MAEGKRYVVSESDQTDKDVVAFSLGILTQTLMYLAVFRFKFVEAEPAKGVVIAQLDSKSGKRRLYRLTLEPVEEEHDE